MKFKTTSLMLFASTLVILSFFTPQAFALSPSIDFEQHIISSDMPNSVAVHNVDIDNDGDIDILSGNRNLHWFYIFVNDGHQNFTPVVIDTYNVIYSIATKDIDQDGDIDIAANGDISHYELFWYENNGNLVFTRHTLFQYGVDPSYVEIVDLDEDGDLDLFANANGWSRAHTYWFENDGNEDFTTHQILDLYSPQNAGCQKSAVRDLDLDGDIDIVEACDLSPVFWLENDGSQNFIRHDTSKNLSYSYNVLAVDMDYDGDIDILGSDANDGSFWLENDGFQNFTEHLISSNRQQITTLWAVDIDHDSDMDVVEAIYGMNQVSLWLNNGNMTFVEEIVGSNFIGVMSIFVGDLDLDGDEDIIVDEKDSGKISWLEQLPSVSKPGVTDSSVSVYNIIYGTGDGSSSDTEYGFEVFIWAKGDFTDFEPNQVNLTVNGNPLVVDYARASFNGEEYRIRAEGGFNGLPLLGEYVVAVENAIGQASDPFVIGQLEDYPKDAPDMLYPQHQELIYEDQPTFGWEDFNSYYLGQPVESWAYEIDLLMPNEDYFVWPILSDQTTLNYVNPDWDPAQPPPLQPGTYEVAVHSNHHVAPRFGFEHHRIISFDVTSNRPPIADSGGPYSGYVDSIIELNAAASSDPDGDVLTYEWDLDNDGQYDDASGVTVTTSFNQVGDHVVGLRVTDDGGLSDTDTATVTVLPWTLNGFYQPVDMNGVYNTVKGGSTVPLKFEIFAGTTELTDVASVKSLTYAQTSCDTTAITDEIETTSTGDTSLRYTDGQFIYNWKTPKVAGKCYRVTMSTMDGSSLVAYFKFK